MPQQSRRRYLQLAAVAGVAGFAGCRSLDGGPTGSANDTADMEGATPAEQGTPDTDMPLTARRPGWVQRLGSGTNLQYNPAPGPGEKPSRQWRVELSGDGGGRLLVATSDTIVAGFDDERPLAAYDPATGDRQWQVPASEFVDDQSAPSVGEFLLADGQVVLQLLEEGVPTVGVDPATGEQLWQAEGVSPIVVDGTLYTLGGDGDGVALQRRSPDGTVTDSTALSLPANIGSLGAAGAGVLVFRTTRDADDPGVVTVDIADGSVRWEATTPAEFPSANEGLTPRSGVLLTGRTVFAAFLVDAGINLVAYDLADGSERWRAFSSDELAQMTPDGFGLTGARRVAGAPGYCYLETPRDLVVYDERSGQSLTTVQGVNGGGQSDTLLTYVGASARDGTYLVRNDFDEPTVSILAQSPDLSERRWSLSLPGRGVVALYPVGEQLLVQVRRDDADELVAFS